MKNVALSALCLFTALPLVACGAADERSSNISKTGSISMPLVAQSSAGNTYRLKPAHFRLLGGAGVDQFVTAGNLDILTIDLAPGDYSIRLLPASVLNVVEGGVDTPVQSVLQSANPQNFHIDEGVITDIVFRFGVGPDAIAFGMGRGRVTIEVNDGCPMVTSYPDADGDGFGDESASVTACEAPAGYIPEGGDCDDGNGDINPGAAELCNGADDDCSGSMDDGNVCLRRAFVTSTTRGHIGGLAAADAFCQARADAAGLGGVFRAWLSTSTVDARDRLNPNAGPFVGLNGVTFANSVADLTDGSLSNWLYLTENLGEVPWVVWTGTLGNGTVGSTCGDWTVFSGNATGGLTGALNDDWTDGQPISCGNAAPHYCFED